MILALKAMNSKLQLVFLRIMRVFVLERVIPPLLISFTVLRLHICKQSIHHVSTTEHLWTIAGIGRKLLVKSYFCTISVFIHFSLFNKSVHGPGPWQGVHGPGPRKWSMDPVQSRGPWTPGPYFVLTLFEGRLALNPDFIVLVNILVQPMNMFVY